MATDRGSESNLRQFWEEYNFWNAVNNTALSWAEIKKYTMHCCMVVGRYYGHWVPDIKGIGETRENDRKKVVHVLNEMECRH